LTATASESGGSIASVQFYVGTTSIASASSSPYMTTWNSTITADGTNTLYAVAEDTSGNYATSSESVTVENAPVSISSISSGTPGETSATVTWNTNQAASSTVLFGPTTVYGSASSSTSFITSHSITLTDLTASTTYDFQVQATNAVGSYATSTNYTFTTASIDTTPPTEPTNLAATPETSSEIALSWTASTGNGVDPLAGYEVFRDGTQVATDTSGTTYNDTGLSPSTLHSYWIAAYDTANNVSTTTAGVSAETEAGPDQFGTTWHDLKIGAGGYITGIDIECDQGVGACSSGVGTALTSGTARNGINSSQATACRVLPFQITTTRGSMKYVSHLPTPIASTWNLKDTSIAPTTGERLGYKPPSRKRP
jgi:hypothetical protein